MITERRWFLPPFLAWTNMLFKETEWAGDEKAGHSCCCCCCFSDAVVFRRSTAAVSTGVTCGRAQPWSASAASEHKVMFQGIRALWVQASNALSSSDVAQTCCLGLQHLFSNLWQCSSVQSLLSSNSVQAWLLPATSSCFGFVCCSVKKSNLFDTSQPNSIAQLRRFTVVLLVERKMESDVYSLWEYH